MAISPTSVTRQKA